MTQTLTPLRLALALTLAAACTQPGQPPQPQLADLCTGAPGDYLDFYFDDLRARHLDLWQQALATCAETCPEAERCAPVRSVAGWYGEWPNAQEDTP